MDHKVRTVKKTIKITTQTDYHLSRLARENNMSEGRIIDKLIRNYLASREKF